MDTDKLFDLLPELLLGNFRKHMLLGLVPAIRVRTVLEPLLADFWNIMPLLSADLRDDFENILRIYPDVGVPFSLKMKAPLSLVLPLVAGYLGNREQPGPRPSGSGFEFPELAAEGQTSLGGSGWGARVMEGQGFFEAGPAGAVFLECTFTQGKDVVAFARRPADAPLDIYLRGSLLLSFDADESEKVIAAERLLTAFEREPLPGDLIRVKKNSR